MKTISDETLQNLDQWNYGNCQGIRENLLRKAVSETEHYSTDILFTLERIPSLLASCDSFTLIITFYPTGIENFISLDEFARKRSLLTESTAVWALTWNRDIHYPSTNWGRLQLLDITEETLFKVKEGKFPVFCISEEEEKG